MKIENNLYKELGLASPEDKVMELKCKVMDLPSPMNRHVYGYTTVESLEERYNRAIEVYKNTKENKCKLEDLYSVGMVYDEKSIKLLQFLADNVDKVRLVDKKDSEKFGELVIYNGRTHSLTAICHDVELSMNISGTCEECEYYLAKAEFIPLLLYFTDGPESLAKAMNNSWLYKDLKKNSEVNSILTEWICSVDSSPRLLKYYRIIDSATYGYMLKSTGFSVDTKLVEEFVTEDSMTWSDIKKSCFLRAGLSSYLKELNYPPRDDIWYFIKINSGTGDLWLKRDLGQSPKSSKVIANK